MRDSERGHCFCRLVYVKDLGSWFQCEGPGQGWGGRRGRRAQASPRARITGGVTANPLCRGSPDRPALGFSWAKGLLWSRGRTRGNLPPRPSLRPRLKGPVSATLQGGQLGHLCPSHQSFPPRSNCGDPQATLCRNPPAEAAINNTLLGVRVPPPRPRPGSPQLRAGPGRGKHLPLWGRMPPAPGFLVPGLCVALSAVVSQLRGSQAGTQLPSRVLASPSRGGWRRRAEEAAGGGAEREGRGLFVLRRRGSRPPPRGSPVQPPEPAGGDSPLGDRKPIAGISFLRCHSSSAG